MSAGISRDKNPATVQSLYSTVSVTVAGNFEATWPQTRRERVKLLEDGIAAATAAGLVEMSTLFEFALLTGVEGFYRTMVAHNAGIDGALSALGFVLGEDLLIALDYGFDIVIAHSIGSEVCGSSRSIRTEEARVALLRGLWQ